MHLSCQKKDHVSCQLFLFCYNRIGLTASGDADSMVFCSERVRLRVVSNGGVAGLLMLGAVVFGVINSFAATYFFGVQFNCFPSHLWVRISKILAAIFEIYFFVGTRISLGWW